MPTIRPDDLAWPILKLATPDFKEQSISSSPCIETCVEMVLRGRVQSKQYLTIPSQHHQLLPKNRRLCECAETRPRHHATSQWADILRIQMIEELTEHSEPNLRVR
jgi:hypothetical protein